MYISKFFSGIFLWIYFVGSTVENDCGVAMENKIFKGASVDSMNQKSFLSDQNRLEIETSFRTLLKSEGFRIEFFLEKYKFESISVKEV